MKEETNANHISESTDFRVLKDLFAGTVGGISQVIVGQPFDITKVRLQSDTTGKYNGALSVAKKILRDEGPRAFYKGTLTPLVGVGACVSIQFAVNEYMKRSMFHNKKYLSELQYYICGAAAGIANSVLASPIEHIRSRLQTETLRSPGPVYMIKKIYGFSGIRGIMKGFVSTAIREGHGLGIYFLTFEYLVKRDSLKNNIERSEIPGARLCAYGAASGYSMWISIYPIDFIKSRIQTDCLQNSKYKTIRDVIRIVMKEQGIKAFFTGFTPTILRAAPANAATFYTFELTMRLLK